MIRQEIIFGWRTDGTYNKNNNYWDGSCSLIYVGEVDIPKNGYEIPRRLDFMGIDPKDGQRRITIKKSISHPYEVNWLKVWSVNRNLVCSHTDSSEVYVWDLENQQEVEEKQNVSASIPNLILIGHSDIACYALDWHKSKPIVASGGKDKKILLWNLETYFRGNQKESTESKEKYKYFMIDPGMRIPLIK